MEKKIEEELDEEKLESEDLNDEISEESPEKMDDSNDNIDDVEEVSEENEEVERWKDRCARLQADFTNYKRRAEREKKEYIGLGIKKLAMDFLPAIDNLERAIEAGDDENPYLAGVILIEKQLKEILDKHNIKAMDAFEKPFDPNFHHAVFVEEVEGVEPGIVTEVLQKGYMMGDEVIRPAMVKVSQ
ncbi:MAG: nucleotide exchange factor GrpE [Tissierellia bacterium]|nr:nucleotide exchange factor GrpE [Tissierellia bacterium]